VLLKFLIAPGILPGCVWRKRANGERYPLGVGRDNATLPESTPSRANCLKTRRVSPVGARCVSPPMDGRMPDTTGAEAYLTSEPGAATKVDWLLHLELVTCETPLRF